MFKDKHRQDCNANYSPRCSSAGHVRVLQANRALSNDFIGVMLREGHLWQQNQGGVISELQVQDFTSFGAFVSISQSNQEGQRRSLD